MFLITISSNASQQKQIMETINQTHTLAAESPNHTYYAPLQRSSYASSSKSVLPMIKILYDGYDFKEIGVCYAEFDFNPVEKILLSAHTSENTLMIYNTMNQLTFSTDEGLYSPFGRKHRTFTYAYRLYTPEPSLRWFHCHQKNHSGKYNVLD